MAANKQKKSGPAKTGSTGKSGRDFLAGKLLIAMPNMTDPRFQKSVVLLVSHDETHAMGVVINKQLAEIELGELLEQLEIDPIDGAGGEPVYYGGPVQTDRGVVVHSLDYSGAQTMPIGERLGITASKEILVDIGGRERKQQPPKHYILAIGHAGWGPGQLESEIAVNAWCHSDAALDLVFGHDGDDHWRAALESLGVTTAMLSKEWSSTRLDDSPLN